MPVQRYCGRFIRVNDLDRLVGNLCTIWIGRFHLHCYCWPVERANRPVKPSGPSQSMRMVSFGSFVYAARDFPSLIASVAHVSSSPALVLDDSCVVERDLSCHVMGRVKDINSIPNLQILLAKEGFEHVKLSYLGGLWVLIELDNEGSKQKFLDHVGVNSWFCTLLNAYNDFVSDERVVWVDIEGSVYTSDDESKHGAKILNDGAQNSDVESDDECNVDGVSETIFSEIVRDASTSLCILSWFYPKTSVTQPNEVHDPLMENQFLPFNSIVHNGGSILDILDDMVRVGHSMGYNLDGVLGTKTTKGVAVKELNCILIFQIDALHISDISYSYLRTWLPRNVKILLVAVYAPQQPGSKRALWDFLSNLVRRWNGEAIIMGDFNDVRTMDERLGSSFNVSSARCFDRFIVSSGLVDVKLEGYSFTWSHPSASKMSKLDRFLVTEGIISLYPSILALCLDRHLSDHRPILLREVLSDFGPTPFRFYQSWLRMEGFDSMVEHAWLSFSHSDSNAMVRFKKKLQDLKSIIRLGLQDKKFHLHNAKNSLQNDLISIDKDLERGNVSDDILLNRMDLNRRLQDIKLLEVKDLVQKSKIKWAIEGDENSKFFHVLGVGVSQNVVVQAANRIGCAVLNTPFRYLGVTVGECMSRKSAWVGLVNKLQARLSKWKVKTLSIGGRLTLLKSVLGASPIYYMSIFKVQKAPMLKGLWNLFRSKFSSCDSSDRKISGVRFILGDGSLWCKVIQAIYGSKLSGLGTGLVLVFWYDLWLADAPLCVQFPRLFALELDKEIVVANKMGASSVSASFRRDVRDGAERQQWDDLSSIMNSVVLSSSKDRWTCDLSGERLPTRVNLSRRGVLLDSHLCPLCNAAMEDVQHVFFRCDVARVVLRKICRWWDLDWQEICSFSDWDAWFLSFRLSSRLKSILEGVFYVAWWRIWRLRNQLVFDASPPNRSTIFDDIVSWSFL
ncbi:RNA-directed DNA polymerase, eukaryota [Tanacetum coccineum]